MILISWSNYGNVNTGKQIYPFAQLTTPKVPYGYTESKHYEAFQAITATSCQKLHGLSWSSVDPQRAAGHFKEIKYVQHWYITRTGLLERYWLKRATSPRG